MELVNSFRLHFLTYLCLCLIAILLGLRQSSEASGKRNEIERLATLPLATSAKSLAACANNFAADGTFREIISRKGVDQATWIRALSEQNELEQQERYLGKFNEEVGKKLRAMIVQAVTTGRRQIILRQDRTPPTDAFYFMNLKEFIVVDPPNEQTDPDSLVGTLPWRFFLRNRQSIFSTRLMNSFFADGLDVKLCQIINGGDGRQTVRVFDSGIWRGPEVTIDDKSNVTYEMVMRIPNPNAE